MAEPPNAPAARLERIIRFVGSGEYARQSVDVMAKQVRQLLRGWELRSVAFPQAPVGWELLREMVRLILGNIVHNTSVNPTNAELYTPSFVLLGTNNPQFADVGVTQPDKAAARLVYLLAPDLYDAGLVPERYQRYGPPPSVGGARTPPQIRVTIPTESLQEAVNSAMEKIRVPAPPAPSPTVPSTPPLTRADVEQAVRSAIASMSFAPEVPAPAAPPSAPAAPPPEMAPPPVTAMPKTRAQVTLFGERVQPPPKPVGPSLADKYRPLFLNDVLGNPDAVSLLRAAADTGNFGHAYIVEGPPGTGKTSAVLAAVRQYLLGIGPQQGVSLFNPDYSPESPTFGVDPRVLYYRNALALINRGGVSTLLGEIARFVRSITIPHVRRFIVVDDVTKFSKDNQEILLPLTERYPRVTFFFIANDPDYIPALRSRATTIRWRRPTPEEVEARLVEVIRRENLPFPNPVEEARHVVESLGMNVEFRQALIRLADEASVAAQAGGRLG